MKKLLTISFGLFLTLNTAFAQKLTVGINLGLGFPMGDYNTNFVDGVNENSFPPGLGIGGILETHYWFTNNFVAGLELGYVSFGDKETAVEVPIVGSIPVNSTQTGIPLMVRANYYFLDGKVRPYAGFGFGYYLAKATKTVEIPGFPPFVAASTSEIIYKQNGFIISPRMGVLFQISRAVALSANVQYNAVFNKVDGDIEVEVDGQKDTYEDITIDPTNYLAINIGAVFTIFE